MLFGIAIALCCLIGISLVVQLLGAAIYVRWFNRYPHTVLDAPKLPRAAIVLCLRGTDPFLADCIDRLTKQDYPNYCLHVVVDHPTDPARAMVEQWMVDHPDRKVEIDFLEEWSDDAYLKTSAVRQCIRKLDADVEAVVLADADTLAYDHWLRDMVTPMIDSDVGVVTGNRWYDPTRPSLGSLVRYLYNACCVVPMYFMKATWGGSLALRRDVFDQPYFHERMKRTSCEDHAIQDSARKAKLQLEVHPDVMMLNREDCTFKGCFNFVRRQLIWTRLYHPNWSQVVVGVVAIYAILTGGTIAAVVAGMTGDSLSAWLIGGAVMAELITVQFILEWLHATIGRRTAISRDDEYPKISWVARLRLLAAWPIALLFITIAVISATLSKQVQWRGITYDIVTPDGIRMTEYQPYADVLAAEAASTS